MLFQKWGAIFLGFYFLFYFPFKIKENKISGDSEFSKTIFLQTKVSLADRVGAHVKNAGPQIGDSAGDFDDQVWTVEENVVFNWSIREYPILFHK